MHIKEEDNFNSPLETGEETINLRDVISKYIYHWPVFILGISACLIAAFFYLRYTQEIYQVNNVLLIKDEKKGAAGAAGGDLLTELDIFGTSKVVDNEIEILKSKTLMRKVVSRLNLMISYTIEGRVIETDIYANKPVNIGVVEMDSTYYGKTLNLSFPTPKTYLLEEPESGKKVKGLLDSLQRTAFGVFKIEKSQNYDRWVKKYQGKIFLSIHNPQNIADQYLSALTIALASKQSSVLNLSLETTVPQRGKDILNTLVQVYNEAGLADKNRTTQSTMDFIDIRLKLISGELTEVEKDVEGFKSSRGITNMSNDANLFLDNVKANDARLSEVNLKLSVVQDIKRYVNSTSSAEKLPSTLGIEDPILLSQINQLSELQLQKDKLLATTGANNPMIAPITAQIETARESIKSNVDNIQQSINNTKRALLGNESQIQSSIKKIPGQERQLISIERQKATKESIYLYLLQKKEEAALSYASSVADSRVVDPAFSTGSPIKPKKQIIYLSAMLLGLLLPIFYIYGKGLLNNKVEKSADITKLSKAPLLGEIFYEEDTESIVVAANSRKAIAEQFRSIRTNMAFLHGKATPGQAKVTLFTSSMSGEGKTFVAGNLAAAMAIAGKKTVLLELDLRKPKVSKYLNLTNKVGLSNYLIGKAEFADIIQPTSISPNLFVVGSGPIPPNPSELLIQPEIDELIAYLKASFDEVLIDTPPIGLVTDAQILARLADATLYLVRQDVTFKNQVKTLDALYHQKKFPKLNVILNGVKLGGSYGYSYGYGYGYGYYSDDKPKRNTSLKSMFKGFFNRF